jgi:hypothetical protein
MLGWLGIYHSFELCPGYIVPKGTLFALELRSFVILFMLDLYATALTI